MKKLLILPAIVMVVYQNIEAQEVENGSIEEFIAGIYEHYAAEKEDEPDIETFYEELLALAAQPVELNSATRQQLERMPFLSVLQVENILYHRYTFGAFTSLYELQLVEGLDMTDIRRMLPFIRLGMPQKSIDPIRWWEVSKYGRHEVYLRTDFIPELKKGFRSKGDAPPVYAGDRLHSSLKYRFDFKDRIRVNITAEKDAGELWWNKSKGGVDFLSASLQIRPSGYFDNFIAGDFLVGFGQGLVIRQGFHRSKSSQTTGVMAVTNGFRRYASTNEHNFFRGVAGSFSYKKFNLHAFVSSRELDATVEDSIFRSIYTTGYHRTSSEIDKIDRVGQETAGLNISYNRLNYEIGITSVYTRFSQPLEIIPKPYNYYYFHGDKQLTTGAHYRWAWHGFHFFGETAITRWPGAGTVNGVSFSPSSRISMVIVQRYYHQQFNPLFAASFSSQSRITNEKGIYLGMEVYPVAHWKVSAYADSYRFAWLKYGTDAPSTGNDFLLQLQYTPSRKLQLRMLYRYKQQYSSLRSATNPVIGIGSEEKWSGRFQLDQSTGALQFRNAFEINCFNNNNIPTFGFGAWQDITAQLPRLPLKVSVRYLFFNAPDSDNRIYTYEKDVLHAFSSPFFSGKGSRYYMLLHYTLCEQMALWLKASRVHYADGRTLLGSGNEEIAGDRRTEFHFLLRFRFRKL